ncbi:UbiH/UbiF/VisC/COQ6 family ubiquinone biosynthesis hydroxylase [Sphingorhabdus sp.]|uniref:UbiH/UbiF/VisC/COQ6 family ubiquinone biosynthesis hydroxylase n=1 Tax=Sphingorhabdus sp. TaxID=1902408 RepID=UPI0035947D29
MTQKADVIIIGGGLVGLTQALALAKHGITTHVVDRADPTSMLASGFDGRTSAISSSSLKMFEAIGLADALQGKGCPIKQIWVSDGLKPGSLDFVPGADDGYLGQMFENRFLRRTLYEAAQASDAIQLHMPAGIVEKTRDSSGITVKLDNGATILAELIIVAEGRQSITREEAGIKIVHWQYRHSAMVGAIFHEKPHNNIAYEIFYPSGPFAVLPMLDCADGRHRSAIVWSVEEADAPGYLKLSGRGYAAELRKAMGGILGEVELAAPLSSYKLGFHHAGSMTAERLVLIGDSAHGIHPIAGQGLNLGLRDVAALTEVLVDGLRLGLDLGDAQLLDRYSRWRSIDTLMVAMSTDGLNRLFSVPGKTASAIRRTGMGMVQRTRPAKAFFMAEARGESGALPKLLQGVAV